MRFNPFEEKPMPLDQLFMDWDKLYPKPYHLAPSILTPRSALSS